jgi:hypothetical protein
LGIHQTACGGMEMLIINKVRRRWKKGVKMKNYVYIYDNKGDRGNLPMDKILADWNAWFGSLGDKLVDGGNPFNEGAKEVTTSGVSAVKGAGLSGYSIVKANSMDEAVEMAKGCPMLKHAPSAVVQVYETLPM